MNANRDPFAIGGRDHADTALLAAEQEFHQLEARIAAMVNADADEETEVDPIFLRWIALMEEIERTPPATIAGCAAKLRILLHEEVGLPAGDGKHDLLCLQQVRDFLGAGTEPHAPSEAELIVTEQKIAALFGRWVAGHRDLDRLRRANAIDEDAFNAALDDLHDMARAIADSPAAGVTGLAIKAYLAAYHQFGGSREDAAGVVWRGGEDWTSTHCFASLLHDAARFVPEIAPLLAQLPRPSANGMHAREYRAAVTGVRS